MDQVLKPTRQSQTTLQNLVSAQDGIIKAQQDTINSLKGFITAEGETRAKFLERADGISEEVKAVSAEVIQKAVEDAFEKSINWDKQQQKFQKQMAEKDKIIEEKDALIKAQREEIEKLKGLLSEAVQHPYKHLFSVASHVEAYKPYEKEKNNGKS